MEHTQKTQNNFLYGFFGLYNFRKNFSDVDNDHQLLTLRRQKVLFKIFSIFYQIVLATGDHHWRLNVNNNQSRQTNTSRTGRWTVTRIFNVLSVSRRIQRPWSTHTNTLISVIQKMEFPVETEMNEKWQNYRFGNRSLSLSLCFSISVALIAKKKSKSIF